MKVVTSETMKAVDAHCIDTLRIPGLKLMEAAGVGTARVADRVLGGSNTRTVTVVCGRGNNGGDGFVIARDLRGRGADVRVFLVGHADDVTGDARTNLDKLPRRSVRETADGPAVADLVASMRESDLVIDAVFGTGFQGAPRGLSGTVIGQMNACGRPVLAVDVPSGLNGSTGEVEGECVRASWTCTMGLPKRGFYLHPGRAYVGEIQVIDIGIPASALEAVGIHENVLLPAEAASILPARAADAHKGDLGRVAVIAGSVGLSGAASLASTAALRSGAGLVTLGVPASLNDIMETKLTEVMTRPLPETSSRSLSPEALEEVRDLVASSDAVALGPGLSREEGTRAFVRSLVTEIDRPCVVDADGLNALDLAVLEGREGSAGMVLTPHPGEMSRLCGRELTEVVANGPEVAREVAAKVRATVVLKGAPTCVADPSGELFVNPTGNAGLASGGSGDVLTGVIAALLGRKLGATEAAALGAYVHGLAGDLAAQEYGRTGMIAGDVLNALPRAFVKVETEGGRGQVTGG